MFGEGNHFLPLLKAVIALVPSPPSNTSRKSWRWLTPHDALFLTPHVPGSSSRRCIPSRSRLIWRSVLVGPSPGYYGACGRCVLPASSDIMAPPSRSFQIPFPCGDVAVVLRPKLLAVIHPGVRPAGCERVRVARAGMRPKGDRSYWFSWARSLSAAAFASA